MQEFANSRFIGIRESEQVGWHGHRNNPLNCARCVGIAAVALELRNPLSESRKQCYMCARRATYGPNDFGVNPVLQCVSTQPTNRSFNILNRCREGVLVGGPVFDTGCSNTALG